MSSADGPPPGYVEPITAWCVEYVDPREPEVGSRQIGAFTTQDEAERFRRRIQAEGYFALLHINLIPVHRRIQDWEWDR